MKIYVVFTEQFLSILEYDFSVYNTNENCDVIERIILFIRCKVSVIWNILWYSVGDWGIGRNARGSCSR